MDEREVETLLSFDRAHIWHPYTSMADPGPVRLVESASGVRIRYADGRELVDAMASWWCAIHGYRNPVLDAALLDQAGSMAHVMFGGLTHAPAITLAQALVEMTPAPLQHVFFSDSGSVSVEVALKMAVQYQRGRGRSGRTKVLALRGGYHGDTAGAMGVCDPGGGMHTMFTDVLPQQVFAPRPPAGYSADIAGWADDVRAIAAENADVLAAVICEPVLQGAGGMHIYDPACVQVLREIADDLGAVLIVDEIATGFGRTGELFGVDHSGAVPDIMCVGKALTAGYLTLAATLCTSEVAAGIDASESGVLMHGPTFMANPLACAVAGANLGLLAQDRWRSDVKRVESALTSGLASSADLDGVVDVRVLGAVGVIQLDRPVDVGRATTAAERHGVWIRPFRDLIYTMPPYVTDDGDLAMICEAMTAAAVAVVR